MLILVFFSSEDTRVLFASCVNIFVVLFFGSLQEKQTARLRIRFHSIFKGDTASSGLVVLGDEMTKYRMIEPPGVIAVRGKTANMQNVEDSISEY